MLVSATKDYSWLGPVRTDFAVYARTITELFDSGATIINIHPGQEDQKRLIAFLRQRSSAA